jgi:hypothetical protein
MSPTIDLYRHRARRAALLARLLLVGMGARPAAAESLAYRWTLKGLVGRLASVVLPGQGRGELRSHEGGAGRVTELEITSPAAKSGEFFLYGGETRANGSTAMAWSSYRWNGKQSNKRDKVEEAGVVDVASGIHLIRERQPAGTMPMRIWSDGKVYPVQVQRLKSEQIVVPAGTFTAQHYRVRGVRTPGQRYWKGGLDIWLAQDAEATPVQIQVERGFARVRLELLPATGAGAGRAVRR